MDDSTSAWNSRSCSLVKLILASADVEINFFFGPKVDEGVSAWFLITPKATLWSAVWTNYQFFNVWNFVSTRTSQFCYKVIVSLVDLLQQTFLFLLYHWLVCQTCDFCNTANPAIAIGWGKQILWSPWIIIIQEQDDVHCSWFSCSVSCHSQCIKHWGSHDLRRCIP